MHCFGCSHANTNSEGIMGRPSQFSVHRKQSYTQNLAVDWMIVPRMESKGWPSCHSLSARRSCGGVPSIEEIGCCTIMQEI